MKLRKIKNYFLLPLVALLSTFSLAAQSPIEVEAFQEQTAMGVMPYLEVTAVADQVTLYDMVLNRGNCPAPWADYGGQLKKPRTLTYGEQTKLATGGKCNLREVLFKTSQGDWIFTFR
ncbi:hypothetical protein [Lonepinella sp. MS14436]|uniref:hypothetical protein n=1 Tax=Lonepinella sp. MS14436 TaxID=3003619 RepID=UPI0036DD2F34